MSCPNNGQGKKVFQDEDLKLELWVHSCWTVPWVQNEHGKA